MMKSKLFKYTTLGLSLTALSLPFTASADEEFHDADPRQTSWRAGITSDHDGEIKLATGGGGKNLFDIEGVETQTTVILEYYTDSENIRFRTMHFDDRFGGVYVDANHVEDAVDFYTLGYMLPLQTADGTLFFPSVNYSYVDYDTSGLAGVANDACSGISAMTENLCTMLSERGGASSTKVKNILDGDDAHMGTVNLYALRPWTDVHYTVWQANLGSSFTGVDMNVVNLMWLQGMRTHLGDNILNIYFELKYDVLEIEGKNYNPISDNTMKSEETTASIGFDFRF